MLTQIYSKWMSKTIDICMCVYACMYVCMYVRWFIKVFTPLELFLILLCYNHKRKCILMGFYMINQHKVVRNCEVEGK